VNVEREKQLALMMLNIMEDTLQHKDFNWDYMESLWDDFKTLEEHLHSISGYLNPNKTPFG